MTIAGFFEGGGPRLRSDLFRNVRQLWSIFFVRFSTSVFLNRRAARPGTGPWYQFYRAARGSPRICHFSFFAFFM